MNVKVQRINNTDDKSGGSVSYQIQDESTLQGVFYLTVNEKEKTLTINSIDINGINDESDQLVIAAKHSLDGEVTPEGYVWEYEDENGLADMLLNLVGKSGSLIATDLGMNINSDSERWKDVISSDDVENDIESPDMVVVEPSFFDFDPAVNNGDAVDGAEGDEEFNVTGGPEDIPGDEFANTEDPEKDPGKDDEEK